MTNTITSSSCVNVTKTAYDALHAKHAAVRIGTYSVASHQDLYEHLVQCLVNHDAARRQTPLVHAGYAVRVAAALRKLELFLEFYGNETNKQIVVLGAGLDVAGLYASCISENTSVIEVDARDICKAKAKKLVDNQLVLPAETTDRATTKNSTTHLQGRVVVHNETETVPTATFNHYTLVEADLNQIDQVQANVLPLINPNVPTFVLAELVLVYLNPSACDALLAWCAATLPRSSVLVAYEPLFGASHSNSTVLEQYQHCYQRHFQQKINQAECFGTSTASVQGRLRTAGFAHSKVVLAGQAASKIPTTTAELFDEHAALFLHLQSYALACAFNSNATLFRRYLCPVGIRPTTFNTTVVRCWITDIEECDEPQLRATFQNAYANAKHSAIHSMVKTALKKDLGDGIFQRYRDMDGIFLVAVDYDGNDSYLDSSRTVLGGIGLRRLTASECCARLLQTRKIITYEIHRLVSNTRGVGRKLLECAERWIQQQQTRTTLPYVLVAVTPSIQESACAFYRATGFDVKDEHQVGDLCMMTFVKQCGEKEQLS
jgi:O-methyltransferase involved in polyketide biosynthesis